MKILIALLILVGLGIGVYVYDAKVSSNTVSNTEQLAGEVTPPISGNSFGSASIDRSNQHLTKFPADILTLTATRSLNLSHNALTGAMPAEIRHLSDLEVLDVSYNNMTGLPAEIGQLKKLRVLNASHNQLTGIPREIGDLGNLEVLDLSGNDISNQDLEFIRARLPSTTRIIL